MMSLIHRTDTIYFHGVCNSSVDFAVSDVTFQKISGEIAYHARQVLGK